MKTDQNIRLLDPLPVPHFMPRSCLFLASKGLSLRKAKTKLAGKTGREKEETRDASLLERNLDRFVMTRGRSGT